MKKITALALLFAVALPALQLACTRPADTPNVLLITIDTLRADHVGCYGHEIDTPVLDGLAARGALFTDANAHAPLTLPSHSSILTGKIPPAHGVRDNGAYFLDQSETTLAEILADQGYQTAGFVSAFVLDSQFGTDQGFEHYDDNFIDLDKKQAIPERIAEETTAKAEAWLSSAQAGTPFFAWVHYFDPHAAYAPPEPFATDYADRLYDGEIAYTDAQLGRLLNHLEELGRLENTIVVVTADHGESLGEHGEPTHGYFAYQSTIHVPLILAGPGVKEGVRTDQYVTSSDILPTVLELLGLESPVGIDGKSRLADVQGEAEAEEDKGYAESMYPRNHNWSEILTYRRGDWKYYRTTRPELYNLREDPKEQDNLLESEERLRKAMDNALAKLLADAEARAPQSSQREISAEEMETLRALGYVSAGSSAPLLEDSGDLPDVKDMVGLIHDLNVARTSLLVDEATRAEEAARRTLERDPANADGWFLLGRALAQQEQWDDAIEAMRRCVEFQPERPQTHYFLGNTCADAGRLQEAKQAYELSIRLHPNYSNSYGSLCGVLREMGELDEAVAMGKKAIKLNPNIPNYHNRLGLCYYEAGEMEEAHNHFAQAVTLNPEYADGYYNLSLTYESAGNKQKAIEALEAAVEHHPEGIDARVRLAAFYAKVRRLEDGKRLARGVLKEDSDNTDALHTLGRIALAQAEYAAAAEYLEEVIALEPDRGPAYNDLAVVCIRMDPPDGDRAMELCQLAEAKGEPVHPGLLEEARSLAEAF